ncbi:MAG: efflux RND transporter periplasmic adaptor subunit [Rhodocyclaceae bacterium]|nr:efflux RND transporter periplasmic adaptor subunit [Rhodocyclaceae bacterium]MCW5614818.1 efflux RND transporter periplasmic adaptor subunit [Rhodocyclaceae bacterium]
MIMAGRGIGWRGFGLLALVLLAAMGGYIWWQGREPAVPSGFAGGNGRLEATEVDVATKIAGRVAELLPREGAQVKRGERVARIDMADVEAQRLQALAQVAQAKQGIAEAEAGVAVARSNLMLARITYKRSYELVKRNFLSAQRLDTDRANVRAAEASLAAAHTRVEAARAAETAASAAEQRIESLLSDGELKAPIDGRVLYRLVEPGEVLAAGGKLLTLVDLSEVYMSVFLPSERAGQLKVGADARIVMDAWPDEAIAARVSFVSDEAQFTPREVETRSEREKLMFRVKVSVDPAWLEANAARVKPGMAGMAWLRLDSAVPWPTTLPR